MPQSKNSTFFYHLLGRFDVLKTLSQANKGKPAPLTTLVGDLYQNQGIGGFYRGVEVNIARACILNATKMVSRFVHTRHSTNSF